MDEFASLRPFLEQLRIQIPIIQAPMAGTSSPALAAAVSNSGALGSLAFGATDASGARKMIADFRARSDRSVHVNVFCHRPAVPDTRREAAWIERLRPRFAQLGHQPPTRLQEIYQSFLTNEALLAVLLAARPTAVSFHFGVPPAQTIRALREIGVVTLSSATNLDEALIAVGAGVQCIVAQGYEAGGHRGVFDPNVPDDCLGTFALTRLLVRKLAVPVVAAGGIMDGAGIAAVLELGASAAQLGTAFIACPESDADEGFRAALLSTAAYHTTMTRVISGRPARCLANKFTAFGAGIPTADIPDYPRAYAAGKALNAAGKSTREFGYGAQWAGQGAPLARALEAGQLVSRLVDELRSARAATAVSG